MNGSEVRACVAAICLSHEKGRRKTAVPSAAFIENLGIESDAHAGNWHRQVSILAADDIDTMRVKGLPRLKPGDFAENIVLQGLDLKRLGLGSVLALGAHARVAITQLGKTCHSRCAIYRLAGDCIMPRLGVFARVTTGGTVAAGDPVSVLRHVPRERWQTVVLTASDRCSRGEAVDTAGPAVARLLETRLGAHVYAREILPDEREHIAARLRHYCDGHSIDLVLVVGGTGFAPRDVTPEAVCDVVERLTPGLDEAMRHASLARTPHAMLSRLVSGIRQTTLIISLPGSERAAAENLDAVLPALDHGLRKLRGDPADCGRAPAERS